MRTFSFLQALAKGCVVRTVYCFRIAGRCWAAARGGSAFGSMHVHVVAVVVVDVVIVEDPCLLHDTLG